jgi:hypothetical protein
VPQTESIGLPIADAQVHAEVHYLFKPETFEALYGSPLYFLQEIRRPGRAPDTWHAAEYSRCEHQFAMSLSAAIEPYPFDAIVCVPTSHPCLQTAYREAVLRLNRTAIDYTSCIRRIDPSSPGTTLEERVRNLQLDTQVIPNDLRLLVIDDVFTTGSSAAAVMRRFQLSHMQTCSFRLAFPLWMQPGLGNPMRRLLQLVKQMPNEAD